jgi:transcriptional regulator of arginine metabolism
MMYIYSIPGPPSRAAARAGQTVREDEKAVMKDQRLNAIRELLSSSPVASQDELRRKLRRRGFRVTQATLSRDIHELRLSKGPGGYTLPNGHGGAGAAAPEGEGSPPLLAEMIESFALRVRQAMNQVVLGTVMGGAQPVAAALDREAWPEVVGTVAGDDTILIICPDRRRAAGVEARLKAMLT